MTWLANKPQLTPTDWADRRRERITDGRGGVMKLGSLFSGIGGIDTAFESQGFSVAWQCEIDRSAQAVLRRHWPDTTLYADVTAMQGAAVEPVDVIAGGFPCQDLSLAGKRSGLAGERSGLFHQITRLVREMREATNGRYPAFLVLENVPGLLSSNGGRDFAVVIHELAKLRALDISWRVLDAQYYGVPQRRRRVFIVIDFGGQRTAEILALPTSSRRHSEASAAAGQDPAAHLVAGVGAAGLDSVAKPLGSHKEGGQRNDLDNDTFVVAPVDFMNVTSKTNRTRREFGSPANTLHHGGMSAVVAPIAFAQNQAGDVYVSDVVGAIATNSNASGRSTAKISSLTGIRRLTPTECEALQGLPRGWTDGHADTHRYRMIGNSVAVPVVTAIAAAVRRAMGGEA